MSENEDICEDLSAEVYDLLACIKDPEFPDKTLGTLKTSHIIDGNERMVVNEDDINIEIFETPTLGVSNLGSSKIRKLLIKIFYTPTVQHCSLTSLIGLCIYKKIQNDFPITAHTILFDHSEKKSFYQFNDDSSEDNLRWAVKILVKPGSHSNETDANRQIGDKERVTAALENQHLIDKINKLIT